ncbi:MAG: transcriptional regulator [Homoserinimonas sp.]|jgi:DNA-binding MarR family transcriptional regulator|nr:transcriptional regulator [Homoserinimonas sp.]
MSTKTVAVTAWEALFRAQVTVMRQLHEEFPADEISLNEYDVLFNLSRQPDRRLRIRNLNEHVLLKQPSVSRLVDRLVARGLLAKLSDPGDGRGIIVELTDAGFDMFRRIARAHSKSIAARVGGVLDRDELEQLTRLCDKLRQGAPTSEL